MFRGLEKNGDDTPLSHVPEMDFSHNWFMNAYRVLSHSFNENGQIPLSELKMYQESFGLIGSFEEFVRIIYAISDKYSEIRNRENGNG